MSDKLKLYEEHMEPKVLELFHLAQKHDIPLVIGALLDVKNDKEKTYTHMAVTAYVNGDLGCPHMHNAVFALQSTQPVQAQKLAGAILTGGKGFAETNDEEVEDRLARFEV